ncbi:MAG: autotransporter-associated beta strand repeat-containing protein, partial [Verrucomicrobia bacterium]|nr:autotransporter-associated beta strand repeat-containing protein [Verrucomicrobiota bacterium]
VNLGANLDTVASLTGNGGTLAGTGTLTAATYALNDGTTLNANLGAGIVTSNGTVAINGNTGTGTLAIATGTTTLSGASSAATVTVADTAVLTTTATGSLADTAAVALTGTGALNLGQSETIGSLSGAGSIALAANTLTLSSGTGGTSSALIGGTGGIILTAGTQTLSAANTYTGTTTVSGGTLTLSGTSQSAALAVGAGTLNVNAASVATTATIASGAFLTTGAANVINDRANIANAGTLTLGGNETIGSLSGAGDVALGANTLTFTGNGDATAGEISGDFSGSITGSGQLLKNGTDIQILSGSSSYSGIATVDAGVLRVTGAIALGTAGASARTVVNTGGTLQVAGGISLSEVIRPTGVGAANTYAGNDSDLTTLGAINSLSGNNTLTGQIGLIGGVPEITIGVNADKLTITSDILRSGLALVPKLTFQTAENSTIAVTGNNAGFQLSNVADLSKTGRGTLDITGIIGNNSTGDVYLQDGTLLVGAEAQLGGSKVLFGSTDRGTFRIDVLATQSAIAAGAGNVLTGGDGTWADFRNTAFDFTGGDGTFRTDVDTAVSLANLQNTTGSLLIKTGTADLLIDQVGVVTKLLPGLLIDAGTVSFRTEDGAALTIGSLSQSTGASGGSLAFGTLDVTFAQSTSGTFAGGLSGTGDLVVNTSSNATLALGGVLSGFSSVSIGGNGTGSVTLSGDSTYTGPTNVTTGGSLLLSGTSQTSALDVATGAVFTLGASDRLLDSATVTNSGTFATGAFNETVATYTSTGGTLSGTGTLTATTYTLGAGSLVSGKLGLGALTVTGDTSITGTAAASTVAVNLGATLTLDGDNLADTAALTNAGILSLGANTDTVGSYVSNGGTLSGTGTLTAATYALNTGTTLNANLGAGNVTTNGAVAINGNLGTGTLAVASGTTTLAGASSAATVTVASTATLTTTATGSLADTASLALTGTAIFNLGQNDTIGQLTGAGVVNLAANTLTLANGGGASSSAVLTGTGGLTLLSGTQTLTGASTYTGTTTITGGTLNLNGTTASSTLNVGTGAALNVNAASSASTITVGPNSVLTTGSANLLADNVEVTLSGTTATAGRLVLGGNELIRKLNSASNTAGRVDLGVHTLSVTEGGTFNGLVTGTGILALTGGNITLTEATVINSTLINSATLNLGQSATVNAPVTNTGTGLINLNNNTFTSTVGTTLAAGSIITGSGVFVQSAGALGGTGTASNVRITSTGTLSPGNSPGVLNLTGNLEIGGGTGAPTYRAEWDGLAGAGAVSGHDQVKVAGTVTLSPASTLAITRSTGAFTPVRGERARILANAAGTGDPAITGVFSDVTNSFTGGVVLDLTTGELIGTGLNLATTGKGARGLGADFTKYSDLTDNARALLAAVQTDAFASDANGIQLRSATASGMVVRDLLIDATDAPFVTAGKLSPETYAADTAYAVRATRNYAETALHASPVVQAKDISVFTAYTSLDVGRTDSSLNQANYALDTAGFLLGGSTLIGNKLTVGAYGAFDTGNVNSDRRHGDVTGQSYGLFGEYVLNTKRTLALTAAANLGSYDTDSTRGTALGRATANGVGTNASGLALGLRYDLGKAGRYGVSPYAGLNLVNASTEAFTETGSIDALAVKSIDYTSLQGELGARGYVMITEQFSLTGGLGIAQEFGDSNTSVGARIASGGATAFNVNSPGYGDTELSANLGVNCAVTKALSVGAGVKLSNVSDADSSTSYYVGGSMKF